MHNHHNRRHCFCLCAHALSHILAARIHQPKRGLPSQPPLHSVHPRTKVWGGREGKEEEYIDSVPGTFTQTQERLRLNQSETYACTQASSLTSFVNSDDYFYRKEACTPRG